jgi:predicted nuclease of predicted toxin-antitoxin system
MKWLANENFPKKSIGKLRESEYDVESVTESMLSATDSQVLKHAVANKQVILTFDKDYGELIFHRRIAIPESLIYLKFDPITPVEPFEVLMQLVIKPGIDIKGWFIVLERDAIRKRKLPVLTS